MVGSYDKTHCQNTDAKYLEGRSLPVFQSDFGTFGVMICADRRWPETVRTLAAKGARVIFNPTYGMHDARKPAYDADPLLREPRSISPSPTPASRC